MDGRDGQVADSLSITSSDGTVISLRVFPADPRFVRDVQRAAELLSIDPTISDDGQRQALQEDLRESYPEVDVRIREELAGLGSGDRAWYVLRDGHVGIVVGPAVSER